DNLSWLSLRYINNIEIPIQENQSIPAQNLFRTFISNDGKHKSEGISNYSLKYTHYFQESNVMVHFAQELLNGPPGVLPFIVDIDVIHTKDYKLEDIDVERKFDELRTTKNEYFFDNLTPDTLELIK
ncbi:MAG: TIGR04255 family protein, partial [Cyclobacteriaceae bacterium]